MATKIVFIHGAFVNAASWEEFIPFFEQRGYEVMAPEWPRKEAGSAEDLGGLGVAEIVDQYHELIHAMPESPVIIGHSFGGLFTEILLDRGFGLAGVALDPAPPKGVLRLAWSELKVASPALAHLSKRDGTVELTPEEFDYGFTNTWPRDEAKKAYERYYVPETGRIFWQDAYANFAMHSPVAVDYGRTGRAPLLMTAGEKDHTLPTAVVRSAHEKYAKRPETRTDFHEFPERSHLLMAGPGWQDVAEYVAAWLEEVLPAEALPNTAAAGREGTRR
ncbi:MAG TPA: alpha/beta fold hydrolase [Coriobacteriia bacterium]|jgi:pimeloyl-ACP methyl ester carboxylesterase